MKHSLALLAIAFLQTAIARRSPPPDFYYLLPSPPCRIVMMTANVLKVEMNMKPIDLQKGEHLTPEFLKINPQHTVPTLTHNGLMLSESRAIAAYLANTRAAGEKIYPKDPKKRAMVDQMLYFDMGKLFQRTLDLYACQSRSIHDPTQNKGKSEQWFLGFTTSLEAAVIQDEATNDYGGAAYDEEKGKKLDEAVGMLEEYLTRNVWAAGATMTLADISLLATVSTLEALSYDFTKYPKIMAWSEKSKKMIPDYKTANQDGVDVWKMMMDKYKEEHPM